jgi:hypothetical protein
VTPQDIRETLAALPKGRAPGPDGVPNEILQQLAPDIAEGLAHAISGCLQRGEMPQAYRDSIIIVLRKEGKKDYSLLGSYRPIALENTLAKVMEKVLADRIRDAAEANGLLPWNQMGARKQRSTQSAINLLTACVQTAWKARPKCVVSMLSLDLSQAFPSVNQSRLLSILRRMGYPEWVIQSTHAFLQGRRTRIAFDQHLSP